MTCKVFLFLSYLNANETPISDSVGDSLFCFSSHEVNLRAMGSTEKQAQPGHWSSKIIVDVDFSNHFMSSCSGRFYCTEPKGLDLSGEVTRLHWRRSSRMSVGILQRIGMFCLIRGSVSIQ